MEYLSLDNIHRDCIKCDFLLNRKLFCEKEYKVKFARNNIKVNYNLVVYWAYFEQKFCCRLWNEVRKKKEIFYPNILLLYTFITIVINIIYYYSLQIFTIISHNSILSQMRFSSWKNTVKIISNCSESRKEQIT